MKNTKLWIAVVLFMLLFTYLCGASAESITSNLDTPIVQIPDSVTEIEDEAYMNTAIQVVYLPDTCKKIGARAFAYCTQLTRVEIPLGDIEIANDAFEGSPNAVLVKNDSITPDPHLGMQQVSVALPDGSSVACWLYRPEAPSANPGLIVYLHGGSGKGDDLNLITDADGFPQYLLSGQLGALSSYVLIPQLPKALKGWIDMDTTLMDMIQVVSNSCGINAADISLTGHSMGGTGAWSLAAAHPGFFARVAPLSGSIRYTRENVLALKDTPVYAFVGTADTIVAPESSIAFVEALSAVGGNARIVEIEGADHFDVPGSAYLGDYGLIEWLQGA